MRCANSHPADETCGDCDPDRRQVGRDVALERLHELKEQLREGEPPAGVDEDQEPSE